MVQGAVPGQGFSCPMRHQSACAPIRPTQQRVCAQAVEVPRRPVAPRICPVTPRVCPVAPRVCPVTPRVCPVTPRICPVTPRICSVTPRVCPVTPRVLCVDDALHCAVCGRGQGPCTRAPAFPSSCDGHHHWRSASLEYPVGAEALLGSTNAHVGGVPVLTEHIQGSQRSGVHHHVPVGHMRQRQYLLVPCHCG